MEKLLNYSLPEFKKLHPWEIVPPEFQEKIKAIVKERLKGKVFSQKYNELPLITKSGKRKFCKKKNYFQKIYGISFHKTLIKRKMK